MTASGLVSFPTSVKELQEVGWDYVDVVLFSGDAFVDHPAFGTAIIARVLEAAGYKVAIVPQPNWRDDLRDFKKFGQPRLFFGVSAGNMDSMVNHYTANKRRRSNDAYTLNGRPGQRPDYATNVYSNILKDLFPDVPVIIGGIEASMRRFVHYDFWQDKLLTSILESSNADLLAYGMAEKTIVEIANKLKAKSSIYNCLNIRQIAYLSNFNDEVSNDIKLHSYADVCADKLKHADNFVLIERESNRCSNRRIVQDLCRKRLIVNPMQPLPTTAALDAIYDLPYTRLPHRRYNGKGTIPAYEMIKNSVTAHRGCFGGCSFCTISAHQGRHVVGRSETSILNELSRIAQTPGFDGHITDIGGPSANMYMMSGFNTKICQTCTRPSCITPEICKNLNTSHEKILQLYKKALSIKGIKKISIGSGIRYDIILYDADNQHVNEVNREYLELLISRFVSGRLKVAPEHTSTQVLQLMRKSDFATFYKLKHIFDAVDKKYALRQQLIPYFIAAHPGCTDVDMAELAIATSRLGFQLEQVQTFTPTPMTLSTVMFYTGINPYTHEKIFVPKTPEQRTNQMRFLLHYKPENRDFIRKSLLKIGRNDLIHKLLSDKRK